MNRTPATDGWAELWRRAREAADFRELIGLCRERERLARTLPRPEPGRTVRIAVLGGATTELLEAPLSLAVESHGLGCDMFRTEYNTFASEMLDPASLTAHFGPDVAIVITTPANIPSWPAPGDDLDRVSALAVEVANYWLGLAARLHQHTSCEIVLTNFHPLPTRPAGNLSAKLPWDPGNFIRRVNAELGDRAPTYVHINDVDWLASFHGVGTWFDPRFWFHAKQPVSFQAAVPFIRNTARIVAALFAERRKCLVLDLDNTLWGGVVGDDGLEGVAIGEGDAVSEAFKAFQEYIRRLKDLGVMLAVCSKNEEANALGPFESRPEMVLKRDDFVAFKANWRPKPENLRTIAAELNIGVDALAFVDDNPAERAHVRQVLPEVAVVELTDDPADYPRLLDQAGLFESVALSSEDQQRTRQYLDNAKRQELMESAEDYASYLATLDQKAVIRPFEPASVPRIAQLVNKSNQFNLTTLRLSQAEVEELAGRPELVTAAVRLADRFGDNGLISVFVGRPDGGELWIDEWLMSCRVLKRGVEAMLCNHVVEQARERGLSALRGVYRPTPKNALVRDHYRTLGFEHVSTEDDGTTHWRLDVSSFRPFDITIAIVEEY